MNIPDELIEAMQADHEAAEEWKSLLDSLSIPFPVTWADWEVIARTFEFPADRLRDGNWTLKEIHDHSLAWCYRTHAKRIITSSLESEASKPGDSPDGTDSTLMPTKPRRKSTKRDDAYALFKLAIAADGWEHYSPGAVWDALDREGDRPDCSREAFKKAVNRAIRDEHGTRHDRQRNARSVKRKRDM